jgi:hypothetical protein
MFIWFKSQRTEFCLLAKNIQCLQKAKFLIQLNYLQFIKKETISMTAVHTSCYFIRQDLYYANTKQICRKYYWLVGESK